jgi:FlaA1/EpsC-like NDP-sugar epimerase
LPTLVPALGIDEVIITIADAPQAQLRRILQICEGIPVRAQMIPAMYDLLQGRVSITELREVRVEDLLQRETVSLGEEDVVGFLGGKVVMVTGAGGAIGSELARQVARHVARARHRPAAGRRGRTGADARALPRAPAAGRRRVPWDDKAGRDRRGLGMTKA